jgi:hypothetical protein
VKAGENHQEPSPSPPDAPPQELPIDNEAADDDASRRIRRSRPQRRQPPSSWSAHRFGPGRGAADHPERIAHHRPRFPGLTGRLGCRGASRRLGRCRGGRLGSTGWRGRHLLGLRWRVSRRHLLGSVAQLVDVGRWVSVAVPVYGHLSGLDRCVIQRHLPGDAGFSGFDGRCHQRDRRGNAQQRWCADKRQGMAGVEELESRELL